MRTSYLTNFNPNKGVLSQIRSQIIFLQLNMTSGEINFYHTEPRYIFWIRTCGWGGGGEELAHSKCECYSGVDNEVCVC